MKKTALAICLLTSGCATFPALKQGKPSGSYVAPEISQSESEEIARDMARFLAVRLSPAKTTIELDSSMSMFHEILFNELAWRGFGVIEHTSEDGDAVALRYFVTTLDTGIVIRMKYDRQVAGRFYNRVGNRLSFGNAYAVREVTQ